MKKNIRIIILFVSFIILLGVSAAFFRANEKINNKKNIEKTDNIITTTTTKIKQSDINIKELYDKFVIDNKLVISNPNDVYDITLLENSGCTLEKFASKEDGQYSIGFLSFDNVENASKYYKEQISYLKNSGKEETIKVYSKNIIQDRKKDNYEVFEIIKLTDDYNSNGKVYHYVYSLRINNNYINITSINSSDITLEMTKIKDELETSLEIKYK